MLLSREVVVAPQLLCSKFLFIQCCSGDGVLLLRVKVFCVSAMEFWFTRGLSFLPIFVIVWTYVTFGISYIMSVARGDVDPGFPYISDTGARRPESSVFGQMLNIVAAAALVTLYVRYKQVENFLVKLPDEKLSKVQRLNKLALFCAVAISLGMSLVANFQETSVLGVHVVGALLAFGVGTLYEFIQSYISYKMHPEVNGMKICHIRLAFSVFSLIFLLITSISTSFAKVPVKFHWGPGDEGYAAHLTSTIAEWCLAVTFLGFFYTFIREFQVISVDVEATLHTETLHDYDLNGERSVQFRPEERTPLIG